MTFNKSNVIVSGSRSSLSEYANYTTVYPKPAMVGGKIVLTQDMINKQNVKYIIKWNFDLDDETITVPEGCLIEFDGGSFSNGTLVGNETILVYNQEEKDVFKNVSLEGSFERSTSAIADKMDNTNGMAKIYLKKNKPLATQLTQTNTIYIIQYDFTLAEDITIPANCVLEFDGGSISGEHAIVGTNTGIQAGLVKIFEAEVILAGTWNVQESHTSWINYGDNVSTAFIKLFIISSKIIIDKDCNIKERALLQNKDIEIDGKHHTINVYIEESLVGENISSISAITLANNATIKIHDVNFVYNVLSVPRRDASNITYYLIDISCNDNYGTKIEINNINISNFDTRINHTYWCNWNGIFISHFGKESKADIHNIRVNNIVVACKTGVRPDIGGANYPIHITTVANTLISGQLNLYNISLDTIANYAYGAEDNLRVLIETAGIYLSGVDDQEEAYTEWIADIHDISFKDVSRRLFKFQGHCFSVRNINNIMTEENDITKVYLESMIDFQGKDSIIDNFVGDVSGTFCKNKGGRISIKNSNLFFKETTYYSRFLNIATGSNLYVENCIIDGVDSKNDGDSYELISISGLNNNETFLTFNNFKVERKYNKIPQTFINYQQNTQSTSSKVYLTIKNSLLHISKLGNFRLLPSFVDINNSSISLISNSSIGTFMEKLSITDTVLDIINADSAYNLFGTYNLDIRYERVNVKCDPNKTLSDAITNNKNFVVKDVLIEDCKDATLIIPASCLLCTIENFSVPNLYFRLNKNGRRTIIRNMPIYNFMLYDSETTTLEVCWYNDTIIQTLIPYIIEVNKMHSITSIGNAGKIGVPYIYNEKIVFYNGTAWVDATGTSV